MGPQIVVDRKRALWLAVLILLLGSALRMVALEQSPPGFAQDEACESYDAYSLWHTGRDQHGAFLPTVMQAFNDYRMPLFMYSMAPVVGTAGLSVTTARLTAAFWSILAIAAAYWVGAQMFGCSTGLMAALFLAISPWHVPLGRIAYEPNATVLPAALVAGMLWRWQRTSQKRWVIGAAIASGLGIYTYVVMNLFLPLMVALLGLLLGRTVFAHRRQVLVAAGIGILLAFPVIYNTLRYPDAMQNRYRQIAVFGPERSLSEACVAILRNVRRDLSPDFLFGSGNLNKHPRDIEKLYPAQALLILVGIGWGIRQREARLPLAITGLWILAGILPAALTTRSSHEHRLLPVVVPWQLLSGLGMVGLLSLLKARLARLTVALAILAWMGTNAFGYFEYYFTQYPTDIPHHLFDVGMAEVVTEMDKLDDEYGVVYFNCYANLFPYIHTLFFTRYDPHLLQTDLPEWEEGPPSTVKRVGKYYFVCNTEAMWASGLPGLFVVPASELPGVIPLALTTYTNGQPMFKIVGRRDSFINSLQWLSQCTEPTMPLDTELVAQAAMRDDLRQVGFDCTSAWLYPTGATTVGAYVLHRDLAPQASQATDPFIARHLTDTRLILEMPAPTKEFPAFAIYGQEHAPTLPAPSHILALPATTLLALPAPTAAALPLTTPVPLAGPLTFLGAVAYPAPPLSSPPLGGKEGGIEVETWWRVTEGPITRPYSIMAHLLTSEGTVLGIADGLGILPLTLQAGDITVQRHRFAKPPEETPIWLRTGAYWLDTMERWPVSGVQGADAAFVPLGGDTAGPE